MPANTFGEYFRLTTFGESHGKAIGGIIDGCPAGVEINLDEIQEALDRRRPGSTSLGTERSEEDKVEILSGLFEGKTTGTPIGFIIGNKDARSKDYSQVKDTYRPSHADFVYQEKYGIRDYRGGGRSSARETACRVLAGDIARQVLKASGIEIAAYVSGVGDIHVKSNYKDLDLSKRYSNAVRCPDEHMAEFMSSHIEKVRAEKDSIGGTITCVISGMPVGLGEPVFDKFNARLSYAMTGINAVKGFEFGSGFAGSEMRGSQHNDQMSTENGKVTFKSNNSGGIQGGITNGEDVYFKLAFKPVASIGQSQDTANSSGENTSLELKGRHDPCVVPRAVPIVEAMSWLVVIDFWLMNKTNKV